MSKNLNGVFSKFKSAYLQSMLIRILNALLTLGVAVLLARLLGPDEYGKYAILLSLATILGIPFKAGLPRTMARDIAVSRTKNDEGTIRVIIKLGSQVFILLIPLIILVSVGIWFIGFEVAGVTFGVLFAGVLAPILAADANRMAVMQGLGSAIRSQVPDMLIRPLGTAVIVVALMLLVGTTSAEVGLIAYAASTLLGFLIGALMVRRELGKLPQKSPTESFSKTGFLVSVGTMSLLGASTTITGNVDMLLLNHFGAYDGAGHYKVAMAGLAVVVLGGNAVSAVAFTRLAETVPTGDKKKIAAHSDQALKWSILFTGGASLVILLLGKPVIGLLFGAQYSDAWLILVILSIGFTIAFMFGQGPDIASLSGSQVPAAFCIVLGIATTIGISFATINSLGIIAIALGSMIGTITRHALVAVVIRLSIGVDITIFGLIFRKVTQDK